MCRKRGTEVLANLKSNWYLPLCAAAFYRLCFASGSDPLPMWIACAAVAAAVSQTGSILMQAKKFPPIILLFAVLSAVGVLWEFRPVFSSLFSGSYSLPFLGMTFTIPRLPALLLRGCWALAAGIFLALGTALIWAAIWRLLAECGLFRGVCRWELLLYGALLIILILFASAAFIRTNAFYNTDYYYDVVYTSDSTAIVQSGAYTSLTNPENDLRQPLFAAFSAPLLGLAYLLGHLFSASKSIQAIALNSVQLLLLLTANFMLSRILELSTPQRVGFMLLLLCSYTDLLFSLMMEQYIFAYFYLMLCLYTLGAGRTSPFALYGAGGTLLTSLAVSPWMSAYRPLQEPLKWGADMLRLACGFLLAMLILCRIDLLLHLPGYLQGILGYTGSGLSLQSKLVQFTWFVRNCFLPPAALLQVGGAYPCWQQESVEGLCPAGIVILILCLVSAILNRRQRGTKIAVLWAAYAFLLLGVIGWGTAENGLLLYSLYFGWPFFVLLFQLLPALERAAARPLAFPIAVLCSAGLLAVNLPEILRMILALAEYYPVE